MIHLQQNFFNAIIAAGIFRDDCYPPLMAFPAKTTILIVVYAQLTVGFKLRIIWRQTFQF